jgi:RNA polymerase sigma-70 factor, ECF subfamily
MTTVEHIWTEWSTNLKQFILKRVSDQSIADDVLQEVFFKIHARIHTLKDIRKLQGWIYRITRNTIIDYYRCKKTMAQLPETVRELDSEETNGVIEEIIPCIEAMVEELPAKYRQALKMTVYTGLTQKQMGEELGISVAGAKSRVQRAREKLKTELLDCCHIELDTLGKIIDYTPKKQ